MIVTRNYIILIIGGLLLLGGYTLFEFASSYMIVEWSDTNIICRFAIRPPASNWQ